MKLNQIENFLTDSKIVFTEKTENWNTELSFKTKEEIRVILWSSGNPGSSTDINNVKIRSDKISFDIECDEADIYYNNNNLMLDITHGSIWGEAGQAIAVVQLN